MQDKEGLFFMILTNSNYIFFVLRSEFILKYSGCYVLVVRPVGFGPSMYTGSVDSLLFSFFYPQGIVLAMTIKKHQKLPTDRFED